MRTSIRKLGARVALIMLALALAGWFGLAHAAPRALAGESTPLASAQHKVALKAQDVAALAPQADSTNHASVSLVQELVGRQWVNADGTSALSGASTKLAGGDCFTFRLVPLGKAAYGSDGALITKNGAATDAQGNYYQVIDREQGLVAGSAESIPTPAQLTVGAANAKVSDSQRYGAFAAIAPNETDLQEINGVRQIDYFYDLVQVVPAGATDDGEGTYTYKGVKYTGVKKLADGTLACQAHEVRVRFVASGADTYSMPHVSYDGRPYGSYVPVFANDYDAQGGTWTHIVAHIDGRGFKADDRLSFAITSVGGSIMRPSDDTQGSVRFDEWTHYTEPMQLNVNGCLATGSARIDTTVASGAEMSILTGKGTFHSYDLNENGEGMFVYAMNTCETAQFTGHDGQQVKVEKIPDLSYDESTVYLRYSVTDNADGTLAVDTRYYANPACTEELKVNGTVPSIAVDADTGEPAAAGAANTVQAKTAFFRFTRTIDVPVSKVWVGTPVEDVTVHLERALVPLSVPEDEIEHVYIANAANKVVFEKIGHAFSIPRADFLEADGSLPTASDTAARTRTESDGSTTTYKREVVNSAAQGISGGVGVTYLNSRFNGNLPLYVCGEDDVLMRAVYRLTEDDTSDAYEPERWTVGDGEPRKDDYTFVDSGTLEVVNHTTATNQANIAAVKQLVGRTWLAGDEFTFQLKPLGKAAYNADGSMKMNGARAQLVAGSDASIPMPAADSARLADVSGTGAARTATAKATRDTPEVAEGERLARFGAIAFTTDDLEYDPNDQHLQGDFFYEMSGTVQGSAKGFTFDERTHIVHVKVRENRTSALQVTIAYDEADQSDTSTGTQFTPVFTNHYDAVGDFAGPVRAYIMGRDWAAGDELDFTLRAMGGAPFVSASEEGLVRLDHEGKATDPADGKVYAEDHFLEQGKQVVTRDGALKKRVVPGERVGTQEALDGSTNAFTNMRFELADLNFTVGEGGAKDSRDDGGADAELIRNSGGVAAAGLKYGRFMYAINQSGVTSAEGELALKRDTDTEYAQVIVVDNGDGTLYITAAIYEDRYGRVPRVEPGPDSTAAATCVTFVNQALRDIEVEKRWVGVANADAVVKLQQRAEGAAGWADVPLRTATFYRSELQANAEYSFASAVFEALPMFLADDDDIDLNDKPLEYRVVEDVSGAAAERFEASYGNGAAASKVPVTAQVGVLQVVQNKSAYTATGTARVSVVKELVGRPWLSADPAADNYSENVPEGDEFEFDLVPLGKARYDENGDISLTDGLVNDDTLVKGADGKPVTAGIPLPKVPAFARTVGDAEHRLSDSQRLADFGNVDLTLSDMTRLPDGRMVGDYFYRIVETPRPDAHALRYDEASGEYVQVGRDGADLPVGSAVRVEGKQLLYANASDADKAAYTWEYKGVRYDSTVHQLRIHFEDNGTGSFTPEVTYDGTALGHALPVFVGTYDAIGYSKGHLVKHIEGRSWRESDRFEFRLTAVGGAAFEPGKGAIGEADMSQAVWKTGVVQKGSAGTGMLASGDAGHVIGEGTYHLRDLTPGTGDKPATGKFIYQVQEIDPSAPDTYKYTTPEVTEKAADLDYDDSTVYLLISMWDNFDGTIGHVNTYYRDAACIEPLVDENGEPYTVWVDEFDDAVDEGTPGARKLNAAYFVNEPAATNTARVAAVGQLVGRVLLPSDALTFELSPIGKAAYNLDGTVKTTPAVRNGALVNEAVCEEGSASSIPMPEGSEGEGAARRAHATATIDSDVVAEGERLASFADITFTLSDISYNLAEKRLAGDFYYRMRALVPAEAVDDSAAGIAYDTREHVVHVAVRETGPNMIRSFVFYDETDPTDLSSGTQFTPVFTNRYTASGERAVAVSTVLRGRDWTLDDYFDYELRAMGGAPFVYGEDVVQLDQNGYSAGKYNDDYLAEGKAVASRLGALRFRLGSKRIQSGAVPLEGAFPALTFSLDSLVWRVGADGAADPADRYGDRTVTYSPDSLQFEGEGNEVVPEGMAYGKFTYAVNQLIGADDSITYDTSTEYAQVLVIDRGDGTLDVSVHIYDDRYGTRPRYDVGNALPVTAAQFANAAESDEFCDAVANVVWVDAAGDEVEPPEDASIDLLLVGRDESGKLARVETAEGVSDYDRWRQWWDVPVGLSYKLSANAPDGYVAEVEGPDVGDAVEFTVRVRPVSAATGSTLGLGVTAAWDDDSDRDGLRVPFAYELQRRAGAGDWESVQVVNVSAEEDEQAESWSALPASAGAARYDYRVVVEGDGADALRGAGYAIVVARESDYAFSVRCVRLPDVAAVRATIEWLDLDDALGDRPSAARLVLLADGEVYGEAVTIGPSYGGWSHVWYNVPQRNGEGHEVSYEVAAVGLSGYDAPEAKVNIAGGFAQADVVARSRTVTKEVHAKTRWQNAEGAFVTPGASVPVPSLVLHLVCIDAGEASVVGNGERVLDANAEGSASWTGLAAYDNEGRELFYTVTQRGIAGFTPLYAADPELRGVSNVTIVNRANADASRLGSSTEVVLSGASGLVYDGKAKRPAVKLVVAGGQVVSPNAYEVSYSNNVKAGKATVTVKGRGLVTGSASATFTIAKAANKLKAKPRVATVKAAKLKGKAQKVKRAKAVKLKGAVGRLVFKKVSGSPKVKVAKNGTLTVKKGTKKGVYKLKVKVTARGNANYKPASKTVKLKVRVK